MSDQPQPPKPPKAPQQSVSPSGQNPVPQQAQPGAPVPAQAPAGSKGLSKGALWGIIGGSVGFLLLIIIVVLVLLLNIGPSKDDYRQAASWMTYENSTLNGLRTSSMRDPVMYKEAVNRAVRSREELNEKLSKSKIMRDKDVKEAYERYKRAYDIAKPEMEKLPKYVDAYNETSRKCSRIYYLGYISKSPEEVDKDFSQRYGACTAALTKLRESDDSDLANYGKEWSDYYVSLKKYYVEFARAYSERNFSARPTRPTQPTTTSYTLINGVARKITDSNMDRYYRDFSNVINRKLASRD